MPAPCQDDFIRISLEEHSDTSRSVTDVGCRDCIVRCRVPVWVPSGVNERSLVDGEDTAFLGTTPVWVRGHGSILRDRLRIDIPTVSQFCMSARVVGSIRTVVGCKIIEGMLAALGRVPLDSQTVHVAGDQITQIGIIRNGITLIVGRVTCVEIAVLPFWTLGRCAICPLV